MKAKISPHFHEDNWTVKLEKDKIVDIDSNVVLQAKTEFKARIFYKKYSNRVVLDKVEQLALPL
jgi:hypothetical protein